MSIKFPNFTIINNNKYISLTHFSCLALINLLTQLINFTKAGGPKLTLLYLHKTQNWLMPLLSQVYISLKLQI